MSFSIARSAIARKRRLGEAQFGVLHGEQRLVLLDQGVLRLGQHADHRARRPAAAAPKRPASRPTNSGIMPNWRMSSLVTCCKQIAQFQLIVAHALLGEADGALAQPAADDVVEARRTCRRR